MGPVPDHLPDKMKILFVGFNPSLRSAHTGHHYAHPNNRFWKILHLSGLTDRLYRPEEDGELGRIGYGFTNIVARPTASADEIGKEEYEQGRIILLEKIMEHRPETVCYVGKGVYAQFSRRRHISWGFQKESVVEGVRDFVSPSSSGLVRMKLDEVVAIYRQLKNGN